MEISDFNNIFIKKESLNIVVNPINKVISFLSTPLVKVRDIIDFIKKLNVQNAVAEAKEKVIDGFKNKKSSNTYDPKCLG